MPVYWKRLLKIIGEKKVQRGTEIIQTIRKPRKNEKCSYTIIQNGDPIAVFPTVAYCDEWVERNKITGVLEYKRNITNG